MRLTVEVRRRAFIMVYAVGTLVLVSTMALSLIESTSSDIEIARQRKYLVLARTAAESGIEYAMAFVDRQLGRLYDPVNGSVEGGPWMDPNYFFECNRNTRLSTLSNPWFYAARGGGHVPAGWPPTRLNGPPPAGPFDAMTKQAEGPPIRLTQQFSDGTEAVPQVDTPTTNKPFAQVLQFQISMTPEMNYQNVYKPTLVGNPTIFTVRSRGEVLYNDGTTINGTVLASAYLVQTFAVLGIDPTYNTQFPRASRQVLDREPMTLTPGPATARLTPVPSDPDYFTTRLGSQYAAPLLTPNAH